VVTAQPFVARAEFALPQLRFLLDGIHRPLQRLHMDAIDGTVICVGMYLFVCRLISHVPSPSRRGLLNESLGLRDSVAAT